MQDNSLDYNLAKSVGEYLKLKPKEMVVIIKELKTAVQDWDKVKKVIGITRSEKLLLSSAFNV